MLLYFKVKNFGCFVDEATLDLTTPQWRTALPRAGQTWAGCTGRVAAIFGPNAAGKTTVLTAFQALAGAVARPGARSIYNPSLSVEEATDTPTSFTVGFVGGDGTRYHYEVQATSWGIEREELSAFPKGSRRLLFSRRQEHRDAPVVVDPGSSLKGPTKQVAQITRSGMLFLATARRFGHEGLTSAAASLARGAGTLSLTFRDRIDEQMLQHVVMEMIDASGTQVELVEALLRAADLGIAGAEIRQEEIPAELRGKVKRLLLAAREGEDIEDAEIPTLRDVLVFKHQASDGRQFELPVRAESAGTISWLTTAWHALRALRGGATLLVDELDASLHPILVRWIVELFQSEHLNPKGAQLIFTSHDVTLLGNSPSRVLEPRAVWFVEKGDEGEAELYSLADFDSRPGNNSAKRYLAGQFGATPDIDESLLTNFLLEDCFGVGNGE